MKEYLDPKDSNKKKYYTFPHSIIRRVHSLDIVDLKIMYEGLIFSLFNIKEKILRRTDNEFKSDYDIWISKNEITTIRPQRYKKYLKNLKYQPKISIITAISDIDIKSNKSMIESVINQIYENWELCIVDASRKEDIKQQFLKYMSKDSRIKVKFELKNKGISNLNLALSMAKGEYLTFLYQHDELANFSLFEVINELNKDPSIDFIYSDEDEISMYGKKRDNPHFKPDWSPDTLRSYNYIGNFIVLKKDLISKVGLFREDIEDSELYDLILRATEQAKSIIHIPKILYHKKIQSPLKNFTRFFSKDSNELREAIMSSPTCQTNNSNDKDINNTKFSLIILNKDAPEFIIPLLDSLQIPEFNYYYEIIIGDTGTTNEKVLEYYHNLKNIQIVKDLKYHFGSNFNYLIHNYAKGEIVGIINNDIILENVFFLHDIENILSNKENGIVGTKLLYPDGKLQHGGIFFFEKGKYKGLPYHRLHGKSPDKLPEKEWQIVPAVTGAFMFCRRKDFIALCGFDENYEEEAQDIDLCMKFRRLGKEIIYLNACKIGHVENGTRKKNSENWKDRNYFLWKWHSFLESSILGSDLNRDLWS